MDPFATTPNLTSEEINQRTLVRALNEKLQGTERDVESLRRLVSEKNASVTALEAETVRLKLERRDAELRVQVEGLRKEVGAKDRELVDLRRQITKFQENEKIILGRTISAEQRAGTLQNTLVAMQAARDAAERREHETRDAVDERVDEQNRLRVEAVRKMVDAVSKRESLEKRVLDLLGIVSATSKILPLLPPGLVKSSKDVQALLAAMRKVDVKP